MSRADAVRPAPFILRIPTRPEIRYAAESIGCVAPRAPKPAQEVTVSKEKPKKQAKKSLKEKRREKRAKQSGSSVRRLA